MNNADTQYLELVNKILNEGEWKGNRTGVDCLTIAGFMFEHDMSEGFPMLTSRKLPFKSTKVELEFFIKGLRSKKWLKDRGCHYWDQWCNPQKIPYGHDKETQKKMAEEDDLGLIYGTQWRDFHDPQAIEILGGSDNLNSPLIGDFTECQLKSMPSTFGRGKGVDQLKNVVETLKKNPSDRRMICNAWNPLALNEMALPPCHYSFQVTVIKDKLNLAWNQRSVDVCCGLPQNIVSYALLLHLLAKEAGLKEGKLIGFLMDTHIYKTHMKNVITQVSERQTYDLPTINTAKFSSIFDWEHSDTELINYKSGDPIKYEVAI